MWRRNCLCIETYHLHHITFDQVLVTKGSETRIRYQQDSALTTAKYVKTADDGLYHNKGTSSAIGLYSYTRNTLSLSVVPGLKDKMISETICLGQVDNDKAGSDTLGYRGLWL